MQLSAQLASALASVLLVVPMFYLGKVLFSRRVGFWAAAVFQCLPVSGPVLGDALSEATFLFWMASALLAAVHTVNTCSWRAGLLTGLLGGLAYLTRPEGAFVIVATGTVLLGLQAFRPTRRPWLGVIGAGAAMGTAVLFVCAPYVAVIGHLTPKPTAVQMLTAECSPGSAATAVAAGRSLTNTAVAYQASRSAGSVFLCASPILPLFAERWQSLSLPRGLEAVAKETQKGFNYVGWVPALVGICWFRRRFGEVPGAWVPVVLCVVHTLVLWQMTMTVRYVSGRHVLILVLCGIYWTVAGLEVCAAALFAMLRRLSLGYGRPPGRDSAMARWASVAAGLVKTLKPLHTNRAGHHAAGLWIAENSHPADEVFDPFCWAHFYSERLFREWKPAAATPGYAPKVYVVLEPHDDLDVRRHLVERARQLAGQGQLVFHWPAEKPPAHAEVQVFAVPRQAQ